MGRLGIGVALVAGTAVLGIAWGSSIASGFELPVRVPDVPYGAWFYDSVHYVMHHGLMSSQSDGMFGVGDYVTRAELSEVVKRQYQLVKRIQRVVCLNKSNYLDAVTVDEHLRETYSDNLEELCRSPFESCVTTLDLVTGQRGLMNCP